MPDPIRRCRYLSRWGSLDQEFSEWRTHYMRLSENVLPRTGKFFIPNQQSPASFNKIYDSTGTRALNTLSAGLMAGMTSPARPWFRLSTPDPELMKYAPVKLWLNDVTRLMQGVFSRSNTYRSLHSMYEELGLYGTAASIIADDFENVIHHFTLTAGEYRLACDNKGNVNTLYREFQKTVANLVSEYGKEKCSIAVRNMYDSGNLDTWVTVVHVIEPRVDRDYSKRDNMNMPWRSVYFEKGQDNPELYLRESGFKNFRVLAPRWATSGGAIYGTSPGMEALGDILQLQHQQYRKAQAIDYMVRPPLAAPTAAKNNQMDTLPGGISYYDAASPHGGIKSAFEVNLRLDYLLSDIQDVRQRIDATFYKDLFLMLANSTNPQMTATEVAERHEEKLLMLGPVLERQLNELLDPKIEITFARMLESGMVPPPPQELQGVMLQVEFVSMLAQAQRAIGVNSIDRFVVNLGQIATFKPDVLDKFNSDHWVEAYADATGVDPNLIVADEQVAIIRQDRAKQQQAMQTAAAMQGAADSANKLANAPTDNSNALTDLMRNYTGYN